MTWTEAETTEIRRRIAEGQTTAQISDAMRKGSDAVRSKIRRERERAVQQPGQIPPEAMRDMGQSALLAKIETLTRQVDNLQSKQEPKRVPVESTAETPTDPATLWSRAEEECERRIKYSHERSRFAVTLEAKPVAFTFISDQHIAPGTPVDFRRMREDAELIQATEGVYAILGGDGVDNHIKHRGAVLAARSQPHDQWELFEYYLAIFAEKIIALISGNHDAWTDQFAGIDMVSQIAKRQRLCYSPAEARIRATVGSVEYKLAVRHQYRFNSSMNQTHAVKQWWRFGEEDYDIGCVCHHHEAAIESFTAHGQRRFACRPGSYQITSSHSRQYGYNSTMPACPTFIVFPDRRHIIGFDDIRDAVKTLAAERA